MTLHQYVKTANATLDLTANPISFFVPAAAAYNFALVNVPGNFTGTGAANRWLWDTSLKAASYTETPAANTTYILNFKDTNLPTGYLFTTICQLNINGSPLVYAFTNAPLNTNNILATGLVTDAIQMWVEPYSRSTLNAATTGAENKNFVFGTFTGSNLLNGVRLRFSEPTITALSVLVEVGWVSTSGGVSRAVGSYSFTMVVTPGTTTVNSDVMSTSVVPSTNGVASAATTNIDYNDIYNAIGSGTGYFNIIITPSNTTNYKNVLYSYQAGYI